MHLRNITSEHVPQLIEYFENKTRLSLQNDNNNNNNNMTFKSPNHSNKQQKNSDNNDNLLNPHSFMSPTTNNTNVNNNNNNNTTINQSVNIDNINDYNYEPPSELPYNVDELMEGCVYGRFNHIDSSSTINMMNNGQLFYVYLLQSSDTYQRREWYAYYNDNNKTIYFTEPTSNKQLTHQFLNLNKLTDIHCGRRDALLADNINCPEPVNTDTVLSFSLYSDSFIFDLEAKNIQSLVGWLYGINTIMFSTGRNIQQCNDENEIIHNDIDDNSDIDINIDNNNNNNIRSKSIRQTMAKRYSIMQPVRQSLANMNNLVAQFTNTPSKAIAAPISDDEAINTWAASQQTILQQQKTLFKQSVSKLPITQLTNNFVSLKQDINNELTTMSKYITDNMLLLNSNIRKLITEKYDLSSELLNEQNKRKKLTNQIIELQGNIRVFCRVRPSSKKELDNNDTCCIEFKNDESLVINNKLFEFDRVFDQSATQSDIYNDVSPFVQSCIDGYNVCVFAYGQTGAGKSYTMEGSHNDRGVNYRALNELFTTIQQHKHKSQDRADRIDYTINISVVEIYNETLRDLLIDKKDKKDEKKLDIRTGPQGVCM